MSFLGEWTCSWANDHLIARYEREREIGLDWIELTRLIGAESGQAHQDGYQVGQAQLCVLYPVALGSRTVLVSRTRRQLGPVPVLALQVDAVCRVLDDRSREPLLPGTYWLTGWLVPRWRRFPILIGALVERAVVLQASGGGEHCAARIPANARFLVVVQPSRDRAVARGGEGGPRASDSRRGTGLVPHGPDAARGGRCVPRVPCRELCARARAQRQAVQKVPQVLQVPADVLLRHGAPRWRRSPLGRQQQGGAGVGAKVGPRQQLSSAGAGTGGLDAATATGALVGSTRGAQQRRSRAEQALGDGTPRRGGYHRCFRFGEQC